MKRVAELEGAELDCWVEKALNPAEKVYWYSDGWGIRWGVKAKPYSADWAHGGPIIERERITIDTVAMQPPLHWRALTRGAETFVYADVPLVAAMRAFVESKFGAEVTPDRAAAQEAEALGEKGRSEA